jgi:hypothetical protein
MSPRSADSTNDCTTSCNDKQSRDSSRSSNVLDGDLQRVLDAWSTLPAALRAGILAMIDAARKDA